MIRPEDMQFHTPDDVPHDWAETRFFSVHVPEVNLTVWTYLVARPGVGAMACDIEAIDSVETSPLDAVYYDFQQHLPLPDKYQSFTLPNGFSLETANEPRDYHVRYVGHDDTELDWHVAGLMEPYDISDPAMDPLASGDPETTGFGLAYANHFDMAARVTGTTTVRGRSFPTDCVTIMDHSWGPRSERLMRGMAWMNATFGEGDAVHTIWARDLAPEDWGAFTFAHGFALVDGRVRGLKSGRLRATRRAHTPMPLGYEMTVVDVDDREHVLVGVPDAQHHWACYSNSYVPFSHVRWHALDGSGRVGHGVAQENYPLDAITGRGFRAGGRS